MPALLAIRLFCLGLVLGLVLPAPPAMAADAGGGRPKLSQVSAKECQRCHQAIYKEWTQSMHSRSTALEDPVHGACYNNLVGDGKSEGQRHKLKGDYPECLYCHAPNAADDGSTKIDARPSYREGVNCLVCHRLVEHVPGFDEKDDPKLGIAAYRQAEVLQGPKGFGRDSRTRMLALDDEATNPHVPTKSPDADPAGNSAPMYLEPNPKLFKSTDMCLGCHQQRRNMYGVPVLHAEPDFMMGTMKGATCQSCHMPAVGGHVSHVFPGGHDPAMLRKAAKLEVTTVRDGDVIKARVLIENRLPHKLPTGAPFRAISVHVVALDVQGKQLWENFDESPRDEDPKAYIWYPMLDKDGKPTLPPVAYRPGPDQRLMPFEKRTIEFEVPGKGVAYLQAELQYHTLTPEMFASLKDAARHVKRLRTMAFVEAKVE